MDIITESTKHMSKEERAAGIVQMMEDLKRLASQDGCIAAAWAVEVIEEYWSGLEREREIWEKYWTPEARKEAQKAAESVLKRCREDKNGGNLND